MAEYHLRCVVDTSILIDLHIARLLNEFFQLPYSFFAPDAIIAELHEPDGQSLLKLGLQQSQLAGSQILEVLQLRAQYRQPSVNDIFALVTAKEIKAILLTNDASLRKLAQAHEIPFHGTLWVLDEMIRLTIIESARAIIALQLMRLQGSHLPEDECHKRFRAWCNE